MRADLPGATPGPNPSGHDRRCLAQEASLEKTFRKGFRLWWPRILHPEGGEVLAESEVVNCDEREQDCGCGHRDL